MRVWVRSDKKGRKVRTTRMRMLPTNTSENVILSVFRPPAVMLLFLPITDPARASISPIGAYRPMKITAAVERLKNKVFPEAPRKSEPLFAAAVVNS